MVVLLVLGSLPPLWRRQMAPENLRRPEEIPTYWMEAARHLDDTDDGTRVVELPGADFTSYRWGTTVDPVTPGITDRPMAARKLVPMGSAPAADLLKAFDSRFQRHIAEPSAVAPIARLLRAGQVLVRSDLAFEHYNTPRPRELWDLLRTTPGLGEPVPFGSPSPNVAREPNPMVDELALTLDPALPDPPPVAVLPVEGPIPIATVQPATSPLVVAGDGDGLVDAAAAGLLRGDELIRYSAALSTDQLDAALGDGAILILTDTNRRRSERWGSIRHTDGHTEPAGSSPLRLDRSDARLPVFPGAGDDARTVALHRGMTASATSYGILNEHRPAERPANAADGDPSTAWRTAANRAVVGERLELHLDRPLTTRQLTFLAPTERINRWVTRAALRFDGGPPLEVLFDARSRGGAGQVVDVGQRTFTRLSIEILEDTAGDQGRYGGWTSTGFAEVGLGDRHLDEVVRPPVDLLLRAGDRSQAHPLAIVLTRLRSAPTDVGYDDEERVLARAMRLPTERSFRLGGTVRTSPHTTDAVLTALLDRPGSVTATASSRLPGRSTRAAAALDGDATTAWTTPFDGALGAWLEVERPRPAALEHLDLLVVADGRHSVPTRVGVVADGTRVATVDLPPVADLTTPGATVAVPIDLPEGTTARSVRLVVDEVREVLTHQWSTHAIQQLPVGVAELGWEGAAIRPASGPFDSGCRNDLVTIDGSALPVQVTGTVEDAAAGRPLEVTTCGGPPVPLPAQEVLLRSADGRVTGFDVDRVVLRSAAGGQPGPAAGPLRLETPTAPAEVEVLDQGDDFLSLRVTDARPGEPLWVVLGQSHNEGWEAEVAGRGLGTPALVDGFANGWRLDPPGGTFEVSLRFEPQRRVDIALWLSAAAVLACVALLVRRPARPLPVTEVPPEPLSAASVDGPLRPPVGVRLSVGLAAALGVLGLLVANPLVGVGLAGVTFASARGLTPRWAAVALAPAAMALSGGYVAATVQRRGTVPGLEWPAELSRAHPVAWAAVLLLLSDVVVQAARGRWRR